MTSTGTEVGGEGDGVTPAARGVAGGPAVTVGHGGLSRAELGKLSARAAAAVSPATWAAYESDWRRWERWCTARGVQSLPGEPGLVALYLEEHANARTPSGGWAFSPATLARWVAGLNRIHRAAGESAPGEHPVVATVLAGIRRTRRQVPRRRDPLLLDDLLQVCPHIADTAWNRAQRVAARRDTAILSAGFFGGFRRSELAGLRWADLSYHPGDGLHVRLAHSKTDQDGRGQVKVLPFRDPPTLCPVCAQLAWGRVVAAWDRSGRAGVMRALRGVEPAGHVCDPEHAGVQPFPAGEGAVFRALHRSGTLRGPLSGHAINELIQRRSRQAGIDPDRDLGGHSLRAGLVTEAYRAGATAEEIAQQTGHSSLGVLAAYRRERVPLKGNAVAKIGTPHQPDADDDAGNTDAR